MPSFKVGDKIIYRTPSYCRKGEVVKIGCNRYPRLDDILVCYTDNEGNTIPAMFRADGTTPAACDYYITHGPVMRYRNVYKSPTEENNWYKTTTMLQRNDRLGYLEAEFVDGEYTNIIFHETKG